MLITLNRNDSEYPRIKKLVEPTGQMVALFRNSKSATILYTDIEGLDVSDIGATITATSLDGWEDCSDSYTLINGA